MIYVMSDIHGNMRRFKSIMSQINLQAEDTLYILGDVLDRYPDGIRILRNFVHGQQRKSIALNVFFFNSIGEGGGQFALAMTFQNIDLGKIFRHNIVDSRGNGTFTVKAGARVNGASYGLLTGSLSGEANLEGLQIVGSTLQIDSDCYFGANDYFIGLFCGTGDATAENYAGITCVAVGDSPESVQITVDGNTVTLEFVS